MKPSQRRRRPARMRGDIGGAAAVEFAIVLPLLVMLVLGLVEYGTGLWEAMMVGNAARAGAYYAALKGWSGSNPPANIETAVTSATQLGSILASPVPTQHCFCPSASSGLVAVPGSCSVSPPVCGTCTCSDGVTPAGYYIQVNAQASYSPLVAITGLRGLGFNFTIANSAITLQATSYARLD